MGCCGSGEAQKSHDAIKNSKLWTQDLAAWRPMFTPVYFISFLAVIGVAFVIVGVLISDASAGVAEQHLRYDDDPICQAALRNSPCANSTESPANPLCWRQLDDSQKAAVQNTCDLTITVEKDMKKPVYFYYELDQFYQNQRVYVKSQAPKQLRGDDFASETEYDEYLRKQCVESDYNECTSGAVKSDESHYYCNPCGLVARSFFTDEFSLADENDVQVPLNKAGVAWPRDEKEKFLSTSEENKWNRRTPAENELVTDPDFIVWMRTAALPDFRKLNGIIDRDLRAHETLTLTVYNNYDVSSFGGKKKIVLSTMSWIGGRNSFLGYVYIAVGALCLFLAVLFVAIELIARKKKTRQE